MAKSQTSSKLRTRAVIPLSLPTDVGRTIARAAALKGQALSTFIRESAHATAQQVIAERAADPARSTA